MSRVYPKVFSSPTLLSLATPSGSVDFIIPRREQAKKEADRRKHTATSEVVSRLSEEAKSFLVVQPLIQVFGPSPQLKKLLHEHVGVQEPAVQKSKDASFVGDSNVFKKTNLKLVKNGFLSDDQTALKKYSDPMPYDNMKYNQVTGVPRSRDYSDVDPKAFRRVSIHINPLGHANTVYSSAGCMQKEIKEKKPTCVNTELAKFKNGIKSSRHKGTTLKKSGIRDTPKNFLQRVHFAPKVPQLQTIPNDVAGDQNNALGPASRTPAKAFGQHEQMEENILQFKTKQPTNHQPQKDQTGGQKTKFGSSIRSEVKSLGQDRHQMPECALKHAFHEACHFHNRLVSAFQAAKAVVPFKRYHRFRAIIEEATREQHIQSLRKGARLECTCRKPRSRDRNGEWCRGDSSCDLGHVMMSAWGRLESLARSFIATVVSPSLLDPDAPEEGTTPRPTCADHLRYRSRIVLLQRHLEKLGRDYEQSKRSWLPVRRYGAMKTMLERVTRAKLD